MPASKPKCVNGHDRVCDDSRWDSVTWDKQAGKVTPNSNKKMLGLLSTYYEPKGTIHDFTEFSK